MIFFQLFMNKIIIKIRLPILKKNLVNKNTGQIFIVKIRSKTLKQMKFPTLSIFWVVMVLLTKCSKTVSSKKENTFKRKRLQSDQLNWTKPGKRMKILP